MDYDEIIEVKLKETRQLIDDYLAYPTPCQATDAIVEKIIAKTTTIKEEYNKQFPAPEPDKSKGKSF